MAPPTFPLELSTELAETLQAYTASHYGLPESQQLDAITSRVCHAAHTTGMTPEAMVIALHGVYQSVVETNLKDETHLRAAYDQFLSRCLAAYFEEQAKHPPA